MGGRIAKRRAGPLPAAEEVRRNQAWKEGHPDRACASMLGISVDAFRAWRARRKLPPNPALLARSQEALHARGWTDARIAEAVGKDRSTIRAWRLRRGLPPNGRKPPARL